MKLLKSIFYCSLIYMGFIAIGYLIMAMKKKGMKPEYFLIAMLFCGAVVFMYRYLSNREKLKAEEDERMKQFFEDHPNIAAAYYDDDDDDVV